MSATPLSLDHLESLVALAQRKDFEVENFDADTTPVLDVQDLAPDSRYGYLLYDRGGERAMLGLAYASAVAGRLLSVPLILAIAVAAFWLAEYVYDAVRRRGRNPAGMVRCAGIRKFGTVQGPVSMFRNDGWQQRIYLEYNILPRVSVRAHEEQEAQMVAHRRRNRRNVRGYPGFPCRSYAHVPLRHNLTFA